MKYHSSAQRAPAPAKYTMYLAACGSWIMVTGEPLACDARHNTIRRGVSDGMVVSVVCAHNTPETTIHCALKSIPDGKRIVLK